MYCQRFELLYFGKFLNLFEVTNIVGMQVNILEVGKQGKVISQLYKSIERQINPHQIIYIGKDLLYDPKQSFNGHDFVVPNVISNNTYLKKSEVLLAYIILKGFFSFFYFFFDAFLLASRIFVYEISMVLTIYSFV